MAYKPWFRQWWSLVLTASIVVWFLPYLWLQASLQPNIYTNLFSLPTNEWGIVFGARVYGKGVISPIAKERVAAAAQAYQQKKISKLYISGDNTNNAESDTLAKYAEKLGVNSADITIDPSGVNTHETCRNFLDIGSESTVTVFSQAFHLPRIMLMCQQLEIDSVGLAVNHLELINHTEISPVTTIYIRLIRFLRESALTNLYLLNVYDSLSSRTDIFPQTTYCERRSNSPQAEPLNAFSNLAFVIAGLVAWKMFPKQRWLAALSISVGVSSFAFHTYRDSFTLLLDSVLLYLFLLSCVVSIVWFWKKLKLVKNEVILILVCYGLAVFFRSVDRALCPWWPAGTHFLWHLLGATAGYLAIKVIHLLSTQKLNKVTQ